MRASTKGDLAAAVKWVSMELRSSLPLDPTFYGPTLSQHDIIRIDQVTASTLAIDLTDGTTIRIDISRYPSEPPPTDHPSQAEQKGH